MDFTVLQQITVTEPDLNSIVALSVAVVLLVCSGFVSASEIAFFSLSPSELSEIEEERHRSDSKITRLRQDSERLLATILISNNLVNVAIINLLNYGLLRIFDFGMAYWLEFLLMTVVLTFLLLLFGEVIAAWQPPSCWGSTRCSIPSPHCLSAVRASPSA